MAVQLSTVRLFRSGPAAASSPPREQHVPPSLRALIMQPWPESRHLRTVPQPVTEVLPRLFISDLAMAENPAVLASLAITHVLSVMPGFVALPPELALHHAQVPLDDFPFAELVAHLPATTAFIANALRDPAARVLVHCGEGISRSPSVVCAYLVAQYGLTPPQAVQFVKSRRRVADPNPGFVAQLYEYAELVRHPSSGAVVAAAAPPPLS